jgi:hypothetical protein
MCVIEMFVHVTAFTADVMSPLVALVFIVGFVYWYRRHRQQQMHLAEEEAMDITPPRGGGTFGAASTTLLIPDPPPSPSVPVDRYQAENTYEYSYQTTGLGDHGRKLKAAGELEADAQRNKAYASGTHSSTS